MISHNRLLRRCSRLALAAAMLVMACAMPSVAGPFENAIPGKGTIALINVSNLAALKSALGDSPEAKLLADPAMKPFVEGITSRVDEIVGMIEQITNVNLPELLSLPSGQLTFAVQLADGGTEEMPYIYFLAGVKENEQKVKDVLAQLADLIEEQGLTKRTVGDVTCFSQGEPQPRQQLCYVVKDGVLAMGNDPEALGTTLSAIASGMPNSVADSEGFRNFRSQAGGAGDIEVYVNLQKVLELAADSAGPEAQGAIAMLGLNAFDTAGASVAVGKGDMQYKAQLLLLKKGEVTLFNLINMPPVSLKPESWVPADVTSYMSMSWNIDLFYDTLTKLIDNAMPGTMEQVQAQLAGPDPDNPLLDLKNDLIKPLGNRITVVSDVLEKSDSPVGRTLIAWQLDDSARMKDLLDRIMNLAGGALPLQESEVKGNTVYSFPLGDLLEAQMPDQDLGGAVGVVGFTITNTHLMLATHVELLEKVLNFSGQAGLGETPQFQAIAAKFPAETSMVMFSSPEASARASWQMVKSGQLAEQLRTQLEGNEAEPFLAGFVDALDGKNLPEFDQIKQYMSNPSGAYAIMNNSGLHMVIFGLKK